MFSHKLSTNRHINCTFSMFDAQRKQGPYSRHSTIFNDGEFPHESSLVNSSASIGNAPSAPHKRHRETERTSASGTWSRGALGRVLRPRIFFLSEQSSSKMLVGEERDSQFSWMIAIVIPEIIEPDD